jgi:hypothetical protein
MNDDNNIGYDSTFPEENVIQADISQEPIGGQPDPVEAPIAAEALKQDQVEKQAYKRASEDIQHRNFAELRRQQQERDQELYYMRKQLEELKQQKVKPEFEADDDAFIEKKQVKRLIDDRLREQEQRYQQQLDSYKRQESERLATMQYKDLYSVLSEENLARLQETEPELSAGIASIPDVSAAKIAAYKLIKKLGIDNDNYNARRVDERLSQNAQRPKSPATIGPRQGSANLAAAANTKYAETLSEDVMERHRREMDEAIRGM